MTDEIINRLEYYSSGNNIEYETWQDKETKKLYEVPIEIVRDFVNSEEILNRTDKMFWDLVEALNWKKDHDLERIHGILAKLRPQALKDFEQFCRTNHGALRTTFHNDWLAEIRISDDSWEDLTAEVVGRGKDFYKNISLKKLKQMAKERDYQENFLYIFQY